MLRLWSRRVLLAVLLPWAANGAAAQSVLRVQPGDSTEVTLSAPAFVTRAFLVSNESGSSVELAEAAELPEGWRLVTADSLFRLDSAGHDLRLICVSIPADARPQTYSIRYTVHERSNALLSAHAESHVRILPVIKLAIEVRRAPRRVLAGEPYAAEFQISNRSNAPCRVNLAVSSGDGAAASLSCSELQLEAGQSLPVTASAVTNRALRESLRHRMTLSGIVTDYVGPGTQACASSQVELIPRSSLGGDLYRRVPSKAAVRYVRHDDSGGLQMEWSGSGSLDARGDYAVSYLLRGPHDLGRNIFGMRDEYSAGVRAPHGSITAGDQTFTLSPLLEQNRLGRGASVALRPGAFLFGGYAFDARREHPDLTETALYAGWSLKNVLSLRGNYLHKRTAFDRSNLAGLSVSAALRRGISAEMEISSGRSEDHARAAYAALTRLRVRWHRTDLLMEKSFAEPDFPGYVRDQDRNWVAVQAPIAQHVRWNASLQYSGQDLSQAHIGMAAIREQRLQSGLAWIFRPRTDATLTIESVGRRDALNRFVGNYHESTAALRVKHGFGPLTVHASFKGGGWQDTRRHTDGPVRRAGMGMSFAPTPWQSYNGSLQADYSASPVSPKRYVTGALSARYRLMKRLSLSFAFQKSRYDEISQFDSDLITADARWTFRRSQTVVARLRHLDYRAGSPAGGTSFMLSYEMAVGVPVARDAAIGSVKGRVYDIERAAHNGLEGIALTLDGFTVLTDEGGRFEFPAIKPGTHYIQVDHAAIGLERTTMLRMPHAVEVRGGRTQLADIGVVRSGEIRGNVTMFGLSETGSSRGILVEHDSTRAGAGEPPLARLHGLGGIELELRSEREILRTVTDHDGDFSFEELRPGRWTLAVAPQGVPSFHHVEQASLEIIVDPGQRRDAAVRVVPDQRSIQIVEEGKTLVLPHDDKTRVSR